MPDNELILIRGTPGSGKSTLAGSLEYHMYVHIEADNYFINKETGEYEFDPSKLGEAHKECQQKARSLLESGNSVVVANTFTTKKELKPYFTIAKEFGITPQVILCQGNYGSIHDVPEETVKKMKARFEYDISSLYEGTYLSFTAKIENGHVSEIKQDKGEDK